MSVTGPQVPSVHYSSCPGAPISAIVNSFIFVKPIEKFAATFVDLTHKTTKSDAACPACPYVLLSCCPSVNEPGAAASRGMGKVAPAEE